MARTRLACTFSLPCLLSRLHFSLKPVLPCANFFDCWTWVKTIKEYATQRNVMQCIAFHCNGMQLVRITGKKSPRSIGHLEMSKLSETFLLICPFVASGARSTWSVPSQWCSVSPQDWMFPIWQRQEATTTSTAQLHVTVATDCSTCYSACTTLGATARAG